VANAIIPFSKESRRRGAHQSSYSMPTGGSFVGVKREGMKLFTHRHVMPRIGINGAVPPLSNMPSWHAQI